MIPHEMQKIQISHLSQEILDMLPFKVCIPFKGGISTEFQRLLYSQGCRYYSDPFKKCEVDYFGYFYIDFFGFITCGNVDLSFSDSKHTEIGVLEVFKLFDYKYK